MDAPLHSLKVSRLIRTATVPTKRGEGDDGEHAGGDPQPSLAQISRSGCSTPRETHGDVEVGPGVQGSRRRRYRHRPSNYKEHEGRGRRGRGRQGRGDGGR
jgi:hypothetical protein